MAIEVRPVVGQGEDQGERWAAVAVCDICGKQPLKGNEGVYMHAYKSTGNVARITCKGSCMDQAERELKQTEGIRSVGWNSLTFLVGMLKGNVMANCSDDEKDRADEAEDGTASLMHI